MIELLLGLSALVCNPAGTPPTEIESVECRADVISRADDSDLWGEVAEARFSDDLLSYFDGVESVVWKVRIQENTATPGLYRLVNPYGNCPHFGNQEIKGADMYIDATDPEAVILKKGASGIVLNTALGEFGWSSAPEYLMEKGYTIDQIASAGYCGTLKDGVITFPLNSIYLTFAKFPDMRFPRNLEGDFRIILPGGKDNFVKINSDYCTGTDIINYTFKTGADVTEAKYAVFPHSVYLSPENYDDLMSDAKPLDLTAKQMSIDFSELKRNDGSATYQASVCIFVIDPDSKKVAGHGYALFHRVDVNADGWRNVGSGRFRDDITTYYSDVTAKIYDVQIERNIENPGLIRVVDPFAEYAGISSFNPAKEHVSAHHHYMVFDISDPDKVHVLETPIGLELGNGPMVITSVLSNSGTEITGRLAKSIITFPAKGLGIYEAGAPNDMYYVNKNGNFKLQLPDLTSIDEIIDDSSRRIEAVYDIYGRKVDEMSRGLFIVKYSDGTVRKLHRN